MTSNRYCTMLENFFRTKLNDFFLITMDKVMCGFNKTVQSHTHSSSVTQHSARNIVPGHIVSLYVVGDIG